VTTTATATGGGLVDRAIRAARLDKTVYEEVERDEGATMQAGTIVVLGALASGIATLGGGGSAAGIVGGIVIGLVGWAVYAGVAFVVGTMLLAGPNTKATFIEVARALGFASTPQLLLVLAFVPGLGGLLRLVVAIWGIVATVVAVRAALDVETGRAVAIAVVSWLALVLVFIVLSPILLAGAALY
jgi:hypothetical protein